MDKYNTRSGVFVLSILILFLTGWGSAFSQNLIEGLKNSFDDPKWLIAAGGIALLYPLDDDVQQKFNGKLLPKQLDYIGDKWGQGTNWIAANGFILGYGLVKKQSSEKIWQNMRTVTEAYAVNIVLTYALKFTVGRTRPGSQNRRSFPSGHTSSSFVIAAAMNQLYGKNVGIPAYAMATVTGLQRIHANAHWLTDVLAGALLGNLLGNGYGSLSVQKNNGDKEYRIQVGFTF